MTSLHIDFETRSAVDLKKTGVHVYATDASTDVWCCAMAFGNEPVCISIMDDRHWMPPDFHHHIKDGGTVVAHNASFEFTIWNELMVPRYGWPPLRLEQMRCTMAMAYALALPGSLENAAMAVGLDVGKDMEGRKLMMQMAKPRRFDRCYICQGTGKDCSNCNKMGGEYVWWDDQARKDRLYQYCIQDVVVERLLEKRLLQLMPQEQDLWVLDQSINNRGIMVDLPAIDAALEVVAAEKARLDKEIKRLTGGLVSTCNQVMEITCWLKEQGVDVDSLAKGDVTDLLAGELPETARAVLLCRQEAAKSSTAKLKAMKEAASADGRVRGCFQYHGASTGRWAGRRIQTQNFPRGALGLTDDEIEEVFGVLSA